MRTDLLTVPVIFTALGVISLAGVETVYSPPALAALAVLHLLVAVALWLFLVVGRHLGRVPLFVAAVGTALVPLWHCRELTYRPSSLFATVAVALLAALPFYAVMRKAEPRPRLVSAAMGLLATVAVLAAGVAIAFVSSEPLRWHLLRHHKMFGTPAYYLLADSVAEIEARLFDRHRPRKEDPTVDISGVDGDESDASEVSSGAKKRAMETQELADSTTSLPPLNPPKGTQFGHEDAPPRAPHLVFLLLDTLRADALELGGGPRDAMPWLNGFLDGSHRMSDVIANASWTRPSMASMLTGLLPEEHGARDTGDRLEEQHLTLAEVLGEAGFETAAFVSNVGAVGKSAGFAQGYDFFHEFSAAPYARAARIRETVERWLDRRDADADGADPKPLFLYLHFLDPHDPYLAGREPAAKSRAEYTAAYAAELAYLDAELALLVKLLDERLAGPKAYFVVSDHGEEFGEHEEFGHGYSLYGDVIRIPAAFHTGDGGSTVTVPLEGRDLFGLLAGWAAAGGDFDVPAWAAAQGRQRRYASIYYSSQGRLLLRPYLRHVCMRSIESDGYKLIWSAYGSTRELYDLTADPNEQRNLAAARPDLVMRLEALIDEGIGPWSFPQPYERSAEEYEQLRTLGYVGE